MRKNRLFLMALCLILVMLVFTGCGKENKLVNAGLEESTAGMSLFLTNKAKGFESMTTYIFLSTDMDEKFERLSQNKQGIDICYVPVSEISRIKADSNISVVFVDTFEQTGEIKGVWVARDGWLEEAPNYSKKYIRGMVKSADYRASNMNMTYEEACKSVEKIEVNKIDFNEQSDVLQFIAFFDRDNKDDKIDVVEFAYKSTAELETMFKDFASGSGEGYDLCRAAYDKYCTASDSMSFEKLFNLGIMIDEIDGVIHPKQ